MRAIAAGSRCEPMDIIEGAYNFMMTKQLYGHFRLPSPAANIANVFCFSPVYLGGFIAVATRKETCGSTVMGVAAP